MARAGYGSIFGFFIGVVAVVAAGAFVYKSVAPVMVLRAEPPAEFLDVKSNWTAKQREAEGRLGRAYWETARTFSRTMHPYGDRLPDDPIGVFSVDAKDYPSLVEPAPAARARYWNNLHKVWNNPEAWETKYEWHTGWLTGSSY